MKRRDFIGCTGKSLLLTQLYYSCSPRPKSLNNSYLVETPEKRDEYMVRMLKTICTDLGHHPIGSKEYDKAALTIKKEMESSLPAVELDTFNFEKWELRSEPELYVGDKRLETYLGHGTTGTPDNGLIGVLKKIEDKGGIPYGLVDKLSGEIKAYVTISQYGKAVPLVYYSFGREVKCPPIFNIGKQDVPELETAISEQLPVRMKAKVTFSPDTASSNVIGSLPGETDEEIVFLAHLDTVYSSPGANDNTASVVAMLWLAHAFSGTRMRKTLTFAATTGEEYGKLGAINYSERRKKEGTLNKIKFLVNLDSVTWGPNMKINTADEELMSMILAIDQELNIPGTPLWETKDGFQLDAKPFSESTARAVYVNSEGYNLTHLWHRPEDLPETVPVDCAENFFRIFYEFIKRVQQL